MIVKESSKHLLCLKEKLMCGKIAGSNEKQGGKVFIFMINFEGFFFMSKILVEKKKIVKTNLYFGFAIA